jgi:hypothetical protein
MNAKKKDFDCVEMKRKGAEKVQQAIRGMTLEQELAFWEEGTRKLIAEKEALLAQDRLPAAAAGE